MTTYNISYDIEAINTSSGMAFYQDINTALNSTPAYIVLFIIYLAVLLIYIKNDVTRAHIAASAATTVVSILFLLAGFIPASIIMIPIGFLVIGLLILGFQG